jgi:hypothetical protein
MLRAITDTCKTAYIIIHFLYRRVFSGIPLNMFIGFQVAQQKSATIPVPEEPAIYEYATVGHSLRSTSTDYVQTQICGRLVSSWWSPLHILTGIDVA